MSHAIPKSTHVEHDERREDAQVAPVVVVEDVERQPQERVRRRERAVLARRTRRVRGAGEVPARARDVRCHVVRARLRRGRRDRDKLDRRALDLRPADGLPEQRLGEVGVRGQMVHPLPPPELAEGLQDAVAIALHR